ncbi:hypothetical protein GEOBRER4_n3945 [Citrifermentans bremense]|uniref:Uncharacterized protein n=1 Tax=Citrifermentans bremense TaxID=60035 RepID=A0A6S6M3X9_9BACT|nr:hypothetical protein [Citrifermentans bremense]BCG49047.1 hypothetical protein GEOBRER4_n3945 [Citrifermentans bremense]
MTAAEIGSKAIKVVAGLILAVLLLFVAYVYAALHFSFSKGDRVGYVQKFSEKGWVCKTWEGELQMLPVPGSIPERFPFSVRDDAVVAKINATLGKKVSLTYEQHKGIPTNCFGESEYYVVDVKTLE